MNRNRLPVFVLSFAVFFLMTAGLLDAQEKGRSVPASRLLDRDIYDKNRVLIGEVDDIIIDRSGKIKRVIIEYCDFTCDRRVTLPFGDFSVTNEGVAVNATKQQVAGRPEFNYNNEGLRAEYFYRPRSFAEPSYLPPREYYWRNMLDPPVRGYYANEWAYSPGRFLASVFIGRRLIDENGREIGEVADIIIDLENQKAEKIVISSVEGFEKNVQVALPFKRLGFTSSGIFYEDVPENLQDFVYEGEKE